MVVIRCEPRRRRRRAAPLMAKLLASVPPEVKKISCSFTPQAWATTRRASFFACSALKPRRCSEEGLPKLSVSTSCMAAATSGSTGVVALLSKYTSRIQHPCLVKHSSVFYHNYVQLIIVIFPGPRFQRRKFLP